MKVNKLVPEVYYRESRDFAYVGRLFELIFNYMKTGSGCVNASNFNTNIDSNVIDLVADTVGFTSKHKYSDENLLAIAGSFQKLLRMKGSMEAIKLAIVLLMTAQGIKLDTKAVELCEIDEDDSWHLNINIPAQLSDSVLLEDLFAYILPAGMTYTITRISTKSGKNITNIEANTGTIEIITHNDCGDFGVISGSDVHDNDYIAGDIITGMIPRSSDKHPQ